MEQRGDLKLVIMNLEGGESEMINYIWFIIALGIHTFASVDALKS